MAKKTLLMFCCIIFLSALLFITCKSIPVNWIDVPENTKADIFVPGSSLSVVNQDSLSKIGIIINLPKHVKDAKLIFGDTVQSDIILKIKDPSAEKPDTQYVACNYQKSGIKTITVIITLTDGTSKNFYKDILVNDKKLVIAFDSMPQNRCVAVESFDSIICVARVNSKVNVAFSVTSAPVLDSGRLKVRYVNNVAVVYVKAAQKGKYTITINATNGQTFATGSFELTAYNAPVLTGTSLTNSVLKPGLKDTLNLSVKENDTLRFTAKADSSDSVKLRLVNAAEFKDLIIKIIPSLPESLVVAFNPDTSGTYVFILEVSGKYATDTLSFEEVVVGVEAAQWKQSSIAVPMAEGSVLNIDLTPYLNDTTLTGVTLSVNKGNISGRTVSYTAASAGKIRDTILVSANCNSVLSLCSLFVNIGVSDTKAPEIRRVIPATEDYTLNSTEITCKFTIVDRGTGVGNVTFRLGETILTDTLKSDSTYQCIVKNLAVNQKTVLTVIAGDKSLTRNTDSLKVNLTNDPAVKDIVPPTISYKSGPKSGDRLKIAINSLVLMINDFSEISLVSAKLNGVAISGITNTAKDYTVPFTLTAFGLNRLVVYASDNSEMRNSDSIVMNVIYNTEVSAVANAAPATNASGVELLPTFVWTGGDDADLDPVTYKVLYGTDSAALSLQSASSAQKSVTLVSKLLSSTKYYWQVIACTAYDTLKSAVTGFTTISDDLTGPIIMPVTPAADSIKVYSPSISVVIKCTDISGVSTVACVLGTTNIPVTKGTGDNYTAALTGLAAGANTFTFTAKDNSTNANVSSKTVTVIYDPTMSDNTPPVIVFVNPSEDNKKFSSSSVNVEINCTDLSGVSSVTCALGTIIIPVVKGILDSYTASITVLSVGTNTLTFTATDNSSNANVSSKQIAVIYDPTMTDNVGPVITLVNPSADNTSFITSSISVEVKCTDVNGVSAVNCALGTVNVPVTKGTGDNYTAAVTGLAAGANTLIFKAADNSTNTNLSSKPVTVIYDPTMNDHTAPIVSLVNPAVDGARLDKDTISVIVNCIDSSSIKSVTAVRAAKAVAVTNSGSVYSAKLTALTAGKSDTVTFTVTDNSTNANSGSFRVIVRYDRVLNPITLALPVNNATGVALKPTFTWGGGNDPDGGAVTYTLKYGLSSSSLTNVVSNISAATATLSTALANYTKYYWQVTSNSTVNSDVISSGIGQFTTIGIAPVITSLSKDTAVKAGETLSLSVTATGTPSPVFQWYKDGTIISGATSSKYQKTGAAASDAGKYHAVVSNGVGTGVNSSLITVGFYSDPIAHWSFESIEDNGIIEDVSLNDYNAVCTGKGFTTAAGVKGKALSLTGREFEIVVSDSKEKFVSQKYSVETWFYSNINPVRPMRDSAEYYEMKIMDFTFIKSGLRNGFSGSVNVSGEAQLSQPDSLNTNWYIARSNTILSMGQWYHLAYVSDGTSLKVYVNGQFTGESALSQKYPVSGIDARIGCMKRQDMGLTAFVNGMLDELKYYNCAIPASVILDHYNNKQ